MFEIKMAHLFYLRPKLASRHTSSPTNSRGTRSPRIRVPPILKQL